MILESRSRGQPLLALVLLMGGWVGARAFAWEHAFDREEKALQQAAAMAPEAAPAHPEVKLQRLMSARTTGSLTFAPLPASRPGGTLPLPRPVAPVVELAPAPILISPAPPLPVSAALPAAPQAAPPATTAGRIAVAGGHHALWLAATALLPLPPLGIAPVPRAVPAVPGRRWSGDGWLLLRPNPEGTITPGPLPGTYGASQMGAVIRYRLDTTSAHKPALYARAAAAIGKTREHEAALGLSARPLAALPVVAMVEARVNEGTGGKARVRPAIAAVTELPPARLPMGFVGEAYAQAGWIGGRKPTGFIDGLVRAERPVARFGPDLELHAGAGAWGAKQRGASRLDLGPVASLRVRLGDSGVNARVEADWRLRVAGRSRPDSGPVLTLSAGF